MTARYSTDSLRRALDHHKSTGVVLEWSPPDRTQHRRYWHVVLADQTEVFHLNGAAAYALVCGLASAEKVHRAAGVVS